MSLIKSISGFRGTIGGTSGDNLTPIDIVKFASAYGQWVKQNTSIDQPKIVIGRDARLSGPMVEQLVVGTLVGLGCEVINVGLSTTPTIELAVEWNNCQGGIILTASHNPKQWNALKLLNDKGEFINAEEGGLVLQMAESQNFSFADVDALGKVVAPNFDHDKKHIEAVLEDELVDADLIKSKKFKVAVDAVNSSGGVIIPKLLEVLDCEVVKINCAPTGHFAHNPEPLPKNLTQISEAMKSEGCDLGVVVDPDVDRLCFISEDGSFFGEEYTLVAVADYILSKKKGNVVSNLSSTRALRDVAEKHGVEYHASAVGEVNVVKKMKAVEAVIGGEGNGGIIYPNSHYGRDAMIGVGLFLTHLAKKELKMTELRATYPSYFIAKEKIDAAAISDIDRVLSQLSEFYAEQPQNKEDGLKIEFGKEWVHMRKSNTEPIVRVYVESHTEESAKTLFGTVKAKVDELAD